MVLTGSARWLIDGVVAEPSEYKNVEVAKGLPKKAAEVKEAPPRRENVDVITRSVDAIVRSSVPTKGDKEDERMKQVLDAHKDLNKEFSHLAARAEIERTLTSEDYKRIKEIGDAVVEKATLDEMLKLPEERILELGERAGGKAAEEVKNFVNGVSTLGRAFQYYIFGAPPDEDLSDEAAAIKSLATPLMTISPAAMAVGAAIGGPIGAAVGGSLGLLGWWLADNVAGRLDLLDYERRKREHEKEQGKEYLKRQEEAAKKWMESKIEAEKQILEIRRNEKKISDEEYFKRMEELEEKKRRQNEEWEKFWREKEEADREKEKAYEERKRVDSAVDVMKSYTYQIRDIMDSVKTLTYNKMNDEALKQLEAAKAVLKTMRDKYVELQDLLDKAGMKEVFYDAMQTLTSIIDANTAALKGKNPTKQIAKAYVNNVQHHYETMKRVEREDVRMPIVDKTYTPYGVKDPEAYARIRRVRTRVTRPILEDEEEEYRKETSIGIEEFKAALRPLTLRKKVINNQVLIQRYMESLLKSLAEYFDLYPAPMSKLNLEELIYYVKWLKEVKKPKCSQIPSKEWNRWRSVFMPPEALSLIAEDLSETGISEETLKTLNIVEAEALARAKQYLWAAGYRGYMTPHEYKLYDKLKEITGLTDDQLYAILTDPDQNEPETFLTLNKQLDGGEVMEEIKKKWEAYKKYVASLIASKEEKQTALYSYAAKLGITPTLDDLREAGII